MGCLASKSVKNSTQKCICNRTLTKGSCESSPRQYLYVAVNITAPNDDSHGNRSIVIPDRHQPHTQHVTQVMVNDECHREGLMQERKCLGVVGDGDFESTASTAAAGSTESLKASVHSQSSSDQLTDYFCGNEYDRDGAYIAPHELEPPSTVQDGVVVRANADISPDSYDRQMSQPTQQTGDPDYEHERTALRLSGPESPQYVDEKSTTIDSVTQRCFALNSESSGSIDGSELELVSDTSSVDSSQDTMKNDASRENRPGTVQKPFPGDQHHQLQHHDVTDAEPDAVGKHTSPTRCRTISHSINNNPVTQTSPSDEESSTSLDHESDKDERHEMCQTFTEAAATDWSPNNKIINDIIHGNVELHPLVVKIIDTPEFQRLRNIKVLPGAYYVFPGAAHNRFEHSIGVSYLAGKFVRWFLKKQPELDITDVDVLCVQIAGLCPDLGMGPFSNLYRTMFMEHIDPTWKHEETSVMMFMSIYDSLRDEFPKYNLTDVDILFITELIRGVDASPQTAAIPCNGRSPQKRFLYEVVGGRRTATNVRAWDRYLRDSYHLGIKTAFDYKRLIKFCRVIKEPNGESRICVREKEVDSLYTELQTRLMHDRNAIQHKISIAVEHMISEALRLADEHILITGSNGRKLKMSQACRDVTAWTKLDDSVYHRILHSMKPELAAAKQMLQRIETRSLYCFVGQAAAVPGLGVRPKAVADAMTQFEEESQIPVIALVSCFGYGQKRQNPIDDVRFFTKANQTRSTALPQNLDTLYRPGICGENVVRFYCKQRDNESCRTVREHLPTICRELGLRIEIPATDKVHFPVEHTLQPSHPTSCTQETQLKSVD